MADKEAEKKEVEERTSPTGAVVYHAIKHEGQTELERATAALLWSALAAGLSMGFSFLGTALLHSHLPHGEKWVPLVTALGYSLGFLIVILGRQQLFTENTLTVILPLLHEKSGAVLGNVLRLWGVVLVANIFGTLLFAFVLAKTDVVSPETFEALRTVAKEADAHMPTFGVTLLRAVFAGWLIALLVWLLPFAESARVLVIVIITWIIGVAHFGHIIVGAVESGFLAFRGETTWSHFFGGFFVPTLLGNIIGGVSLVALINHAQVVAGEKGDDA